MLKHPKRRKQRRSRNTITASKRRSTPALRFSPTAWAKLLFLRDYGEREVGGFGVSTASDLLCVEDIQLVRQDCSWAHVAFDDDSVADYFDSQVEAGRRPEQFARIWVHTHPGDCPRPSGTDEETFTRVFGGSDWAVMFILAKGGQSYARLRFNTGPGADWRMAVEIDYSRPFPGCELADWEGEYVANVHCQQSMLTERSRHQFGALSPLDDQLPSEWYETWDEYLDEDESRKGATL